MSGRLAQRVSVRGTKNMGLGMWIYRASNALRANFIVSSAARAEAAKGILRPNPCVVNLARTWRVSWFKSCVSKTASIAPFRQGVNFDSIQPGQRSDILGPHPLRAACLDPNPDQTCGPRAEFLPFCDLTIDRAVGQLIALRSCPSGLTLNFGSVFLFPPAPDHPNKVVPFRS